MNSGVHYIIFCGLHQETHRHCGRIVLHAYYGVVLFISTENRLYMVQFADKTLVYCNTNDYDGTCVCCLFDEYHCHCKACDGQAFLSLNGVCCLDNYFFYCVCSLLFHLQKCLSCPSFFIVDFHCFSFVASAVFHQGIADITILSSHIFVQRLFVDCRILHCFHQLKN